MAGHEVMYAICENKCLVEIGSVFPTGGTEGKIRTIGRSGDGKKIKCLSYSGLPISSIPKHGAGFTYLRDFNVPNNIIPYDKVIPLEAYVIIHNGFFGNKSAEKNQAFIFPAGNGFQIQFESMMEKLNFSLNSGSADVYFMYLEED